MINFVLSSSNLQAEMKDCLQPNNTHMRTFQSYPWNIFNICAEKLEKGVSKSAKRANAFSTTNLSYRK
jgi:hypothetical protein